MNIRRMSTDVLILGGGTAGLRAGVAASEAGASVTILRKGPPNVWIVAFNAPVLDDRDSPGTYFDDMVNQGKFIADFDLASTLTSDAIKQVRFFEEHGISFRHDDKGYKPRLTSGNQIPRSLYTTDRTGPEIISCMQRLLREREVNLKDGKSAISLLVNDGRIAGAVVVDRKNWCLEVYQAKAVIMATGGIGRLNAVSNNHPSLKGDGYLIAYRAGAELIDMEFIQYEPFWVIVPGMDETNGTSFLLHDGPSIYNIDREEFLPNNGIGLGKAELSREIFLQVQAGKGTPNGGIYFDLTSVPKKKLELHPRFLEFCRRAGLDPTKEPLEVGPTQHYMMGGVRIDTRGQSTIPGLFAAGEVAGGVHGADRMAGNSGTDVLVYGARAGYFAAEHAKSTNFVSINPQNLSDNPPILERFVGKNQMDHEAVGKIHFHLQRIMWEKAGIIREKKDLENASEEIRALKEDALSMRAIELKGQVELLELEHQLLLAEMIVRGALLREESRGAHFRSDFPYRDDEKWLKSIITNLIRGEMENSFVGPKWVRI